jgi:hypothetical protein
MFNPTAAAKPEESKDASGNPVTPTPEKLSEQEEKKDAFLKQPFEYISKKWIKTVKSNEE